jgi:hypothetical protein
MGSLFAFLEKSLGAKCKNGLDIVACRVFIVHLLYDKMVKDQFFFAGLHNSLCTDTMVQALYICVMQAQPTLC